jgi:uncharacterized protein with ParB-like and HNH nuclease domain
MEAYPNPIIQFFDGFRQSVIPLYQRPYEWKEKRWEDMWQDILERYEAETDASHFMGTIVTMDAKSIPLGVRKHSIIDGQQRLTTLAILLCSIRDRLPSDSIEKKRIENHYLINDGYDGWEYLKILPTQDDREAFKEIVTNTSHRKLSLMYRAYEYFLKKLESVDSDGNPIDVKRLFYTIERKLIIVNINLGNSDDPYLIFESLNAKGSPLTQADLVRNYFLMRFPVNVQDDVYKHLWLPMQRRLNDDLTEFMRHYLMREGVEVRKGDVYSELKKRLQDLQPDNVERFLADMDKLSGYYLKFIHPADEAEPDLRKKFDQLLNWDVTTAHPLLLKLYEAYDSGKLDKDDFYYCLRTIESFVVRRDVCGVPTNQLKRIFLQASKNFQETNTWFWLRKELSSGASGGRWPKDTEFKEAWSHYPAYSKGKRCKLILDALEQSYGHKELADLEPATIEHIMPQTLDNEWRNILGERADDVNEKYGDTIGNLTLTGYNPDLSNLSFNKKKTIYADSHYSMNDWIANQDKWTEVEILKRAEILWDKARSVWLAPQD